MKSLSARGLVSTCVISAAAVAALLAPGAANAALLKQCEGENIGAAGSSLQFEAQEVWNKTFNEPLTGSTAKTTCNGTNGAKKKPTVLYRSTSSGKGFEEWNNPASDEPPLISGEKFGADAFIGTDNTVNPAEKAELEAKGAPGKGGTILTVPVLEGAVAVIVHLPENCLASSKASAHRLTLNQPTLEGIFAGTVTEWSQITDDGDKLAAKAAIKVTGVTATKGSKTVTVASGGFPGVTVGMPVTGTGIPASTTVESIVSENELTLSHAATANEASDTLTFKYTCNPNTLINTVVRKDGSGTTHIFKRFLNWSNTGTLSTEDGPLTWDELSEGAHSTLWPTGVGAIKGNKGEGEVKEVAKTVSSIGYANLADARNPAYGGSFTPPLGGEKTETFWAEIESSNVENPETHVITRTYADPSSNKEIATKASANCKDTEYSNGTASFPPPSVESAWNNVTTDQYSKTTYPICGLTYDLVIANYFAYSSLGTSQAEATTVENYMAYVLDAKGGQKEIANNDYLALPKVVLADSLEGLPLINWLS